MSIVLGQVEGGGALAVELPVLVESRALITGNSGAGKSRLMRRLVEQAFGKVQILVIDPEGEFSTLREKHGFILAGKGGEIAAEPRAAALMARRLLELRASAVIDIYDLKIGEQRGFVQNFIESLMERPRDTYSPVMVIVDEAQRFCPEQGDALSTDAVISLMTQGRKRGLCGILATQRLSMLSKDAAAQANNNFIGRTTLDVDQKRAAAVLGLTGVIERVALRDMIQGTFLAYGPALSRVGIVRFQGGEVFTTHPKAGQRHAAAVAPAPDAVRKIAAELADLPTKAEEEIRTLQAAQARIRELEREIRARPKEPVDRTVETKVEVSVLKPADLKRIDAAAERISKATDRWGLVLAALAHARDRFDQAQGVVVTALGLLREDIARASNPTKPTTIAVPARATARSGAGGAPSAPPALLPHRPTVDAGLPVVQQKILDGLAALQSAGFRATRQQLGLWTGYTNPLSGGFTEPLGKLKEAGLIDYPFAGTVELTDEGRDRAAWPKVPMTSQILQAHIMENVGRVRAPALKILKLVLAAHPNEITRAELGAAAGYTNVLSGGFTEPLGWLAARALVEYPRPGHVKAGRVLFVEGN